MQSNNTGETTWSENHQPDSDPVCLVTPPLPDLDPAHPLRGGSKVDLASMSDAERAFIAFILRGAADIIDPSRVPGEILRDDKVARDRLEGSAQSGHASRSSVTSMFKKLALAGQLVVEVSRVPVGTHDLDLKHD